MIDLAIKEFKKLLYEYYPHITCLYAECLSLVDKKDYPIIKEAEVTAVIERNNLINKGTPKSLRL